MVSRNIAEGGASLQALMQAAGAITAQLGAAATNAEAPAAGGNVAASAAAPSSTVAGDESARVTRDIQGCCRQCCTSAA